MTTTFTDVEFMTATEKARLDKQWTRFLAANMARDKFTKAIYHHLHMHCNHIAEYDINGFYHQWLSTGERRLRFMQQFLSDHESGCLYWGAGESYRDINTVMYYTLCEHADRIAALAEHAQAENLRENISRQQAQLDALEGR